MSVMENFIVKCRREDCYVTLCRGPEEVGGDSTHLLPLPQPPENETIFFVHHQHCGGNTQQMQLQTCLSST